MTDRRIVHVNLSRGFRGGERQTELLIRELDARGLRQRAVVRPDSPLRGRLEGLAGVDCRTATTPWLPRPRLLGGGLVHAHEAKAAHLAHLAHRVADTPYVVTRRAWERPRDKRLNHVLYRRAAAVVAISEAVRGTLAAFDPTLAPRVVNSAADPAPADTARVAALRDRWQGGFVVGHVGALLDRHKGQRVLIEAARRLAPDIPGLRVVLLGAGPDEAPLRQLAADVPAVEFEGFVDDVGSYLAAFDVFAFPSRYEALGSSLLDAMGAGLPVVASDVDGIPELVRHDSEGLLVPPGDAGALADALLALYRAPDRRNRLGETARRRAGEFSAAAMADRYLAIYDSILPGAFR